MANRREKAENVTLDDNSLGCLVLCALIVGVFIYFPYTFWYAPSQRADVFAKDAAGQLVVLRQEALASVRSQVSASIIAANPRLEILEAGNLDIYVTAEEFQEVPYPDRAAFTGRVGRAWCSGLEISFLPAVQFRNIKTGEVLAKYSCALKKATLY